MVNPGAMVNESRLLVLWAMGCVPSITVTVTLKVPLTAGVPLMVPVDPMLRPVGNCVALQLSGVLPPDAESEVL